MFVKDLPNEVLFVELSQDVNSIKEHYPQFSEYDTFFVRVEDGEYVELYGMYGCVPWLSRNVFKLI